MDRSDSFLSAGGGAEKKNSKWREGDLEMLTGHARERRDKWSSLLGLASCFLERLSQRIEKAPSETWEEWRWAKCLIGF